jgi:shikimate dehydrogenase
MSRICLCGLIGKSIDYTKSPSIHSYWYSKYEIKCYYIPINVSEKNVLNTIKTLSNVNFVGVNITIPYKNTVFSLCSDVDDRAAQLEAVNTLVFEKNGKITGYNTDIYGFQKGLLK